MPKPSVNANTGNAQIKKQGHTAEKHGSDPQMKGKGINEPRDLSAK